MTSEKRKDYFDWDETFMAMCFVIAQRSKDPSSQNGACLVNQDNVVIGMGYNGFPRGCSDDVLPWGRDAENIADTKYPYVVHSELNAILNCHSSTKGAKLYCTLIPCHDCAKAIIQKGIKEVIYLQPKFKQFTGRVPYITGERVFKLAGVKLRQYKPKYNLKFEKA